MTSVLGGMKSHEFKRSWILLVSIIEMGRGHGRVLRRRNFADTGCKEKQSNFVPGTKASK